VTERFIGSTAALATLAAPAQLAIVKHVQRHGGRSTSERVGRGSCFTLLLPPSRVRHDFAPARVVAAA
jgi:hypothetical protein